LAVFSAAAASKETEVYPVKDGYKKGQILQGVLSNKIMVLAEECLEHVMGIGFALVLFLTTQKPLKLHHGKVEHFCGYGDSLYVW